LAEQALHDLDGGPEAEEDPEAGDDAEEDGHEGLLKHFQLSDNF
jgi:hypothetical protein